MMMWLSVIWTSKTLYPDAAVVCPDLDQVHWEYHVLWEKGASGAASWADQSLPLLRHCKHFQGLQWGGEHVNISKDYNWGNWKHKRGQSYSKDTAYYYWGCQEVIMTWSSCTELYMMTWGARSRVATIRQLIWYPFFLKGE